MENETELAYAEVDAILELLEEEFLERIPLNVREYFKDEKNKDYQPKIDVNKPLNMQNLKRETMVLLAILNLNYWCDSEEEKQEILNSFAENEKLKQLEAKELAEKYNPDNLFKKRENLEATTEVSMIEYKEPNFMQKLLNKIKSFFRR